MMEYMGLDIETSEEVYRPSDDSFLSAEMVKGQLGSFKTKALEVLDVGTGSGILGLVAAASGKAGRVVFLDVNPKALELSRKNFEINRKKMKASSEFVRSDLLSGISDRDSFDMIIFNAPYLKNERENEEAEHNPWSGGKRGIEVSVKFLEQSLRHLKNGGVIVLNASSLGNPEGLTAAIERMNLRVIERKGVHLFFEDMLSFAIARK